MTVGAKFSLSFAGRTLALATMLMTGMATPASLGLAQDEEQPYFLLDDDRRIYRSPYFLGRGDTGISVADNEEAIFYNPAGLAAGKGIYKKTVLVSPVVEVSNATKDLARQLAAEDADTVDTVRQNVGKPNHAGLQNFTGIIFRRAALGAFMSSSLDLLAYKSPEYGGLEVVEAAGTQNAGITFSLAEKFWKDRMMLGFTGKYIARGRGQIAASAADAEALKETIKDTDNFLGIGEGGGADIGLMFHGGGRINPAFGLTINDVGDTKITPSEETDLDLDLKQTVNVGVSVEPGTKFSKLRLLADYRDATGAVLTNPRQRLHLGAELTVLDMFGITGGVHHGYAAGGVYMDLYFLRLDLGAYTVERGERVGDRPDTRYFFGLKVGF